MKHIMTVVSAIAAVAIVAIAGMFAAQTASAAPQGAATNLSFSGQACQSDGSVAGILGWAPSGLGSQYVDLASDINFNNVSRGGLYASSASSVSLTQLRAGTTYYARVLTVASTGTLTSDTVALKPDCTPGSITKPTNLTSQALTTASIRFDWKPGESNSWFCVDTARSLSDLVNARGTWRNHGCWTTGSSLTVTGLGCSTQYYWLVYAWNSTSNVKSDPKLAETKSCTSMISPPTNLSSSLQNDGGVLFDWSAGTGNNWYCVDTAESSSDLRSLSGTWRNHGCWTTSTQLAVYNLECSTTYYWLVYAWNNAANTRSAVSTAESQACKSETELAPILDVDVIKSGDDYRAEITAALPNGCHTADGFRVQRSGHTIEITVWNDVAPGPCTEIFTEYELNVNLGDDFVSGDTYTVIVNDDESDRFIAE